MAGKEYSIDLAALRAKHLYEFDDFRLHELSSFEEAQMKGGLLESVRWFFWLRAFDSYHVWIRRSTVDIKSPVSERNSTTDSNDKDLFSIP